MRYKERIIEHNLHKPREYHTDSLKLQEVDFDSSVISHHPKSFEYYFTHGLVVNDRRYIVKEFFVKHGKLYAILTEDEDTYYEMYLSFLDENVIEDLKKDISDLKAKDKQFDKRLSDLENVRKQNQTLSINDRTISISGGNSIELPADKDTIYDDTALKQRVKNLEDKPDKADQTLSINDRTISISNGNSIELPADKDTIYDDTALKQRVKTLEDKPDKDDQTLSINDRTISISGGNSIELPADKDTIYDDTALEQRVKNLEDKPDKADQTLSINDRTISISNGNSIELPADKDTKYTVKGTGLFMDPDNSIRLDAKPLYYKYDHFDPNNYTRIFPNLDIVRLSSNMRFNGTTDYVKSGEKYQIQGLSGRVFGLTNLVQSYHDVTAKVTYDDEYGKSSDTQSISGAVTDTSGYNSNKFDYRILLSDYLYLNVNLNYDLGRNSDKLTFGYNIDLVFIPESPDRIHTYTKAVEHNEIDSKEPIVISVIDGSKEKYHVEVVINNMGIEVLSRDAFMTFKDPDSGNYVKRGGIDG